MATKQKPKPKKKKKLGEPTLHLEHHQVLLAPIVTEKGTHLVERHNAYAFRVHKLATKTQIKDAVEYLFDVRVLDVRTQNRVGKSRRFKASKGKTSAWKKAYVTLSQEHRIALF